MNNQPDRRALAESIKKEVLMDLNRSQGRYREQHLIDSIKREVLMELDRNHTGMPAYPDRAFIEAVKEEVLSGIREETHAGSPVYGGSGYPDREAIESIKREVIDQIKFEQEHRGVQYSPAQGKVPELD